MRILITNDDGFNAAGIKALRKIALEIFGWEHRDYCQTENSYIRYLKNKEDGGYDLMHNNDKKNSKILHLQ